MKTTNAVAVNSQQAAAAPARSRASAAWLSVPAVRWKPIPIATSARPQRP